MTMSTGCAADGAPAARPAERRPRRRFSGAGTGGSSSESADSSPWRTGTTIWAASAGAGSSRLTDPPAFGCPASKPSSSAPSAASTPARAAASIQSISSDSDPPCAGRFRSASNAVPASPSPPWPACSSPTCSSPACSWSPPSGGGFGPRGSGRRPAGTSTTLGTTMSSIRSASRPRPRRDFPDRRSDRLSSIAVATTGRSCSTSPRPPQCGHGSENASTRPVPMRLRVICTRPSEVTSAT